MKCLICHKPIKAKENSFFTMRPVACKNHRHGYKKIRWCRICDMAHPAETYAIIKEADAATDKQQARERVYWQEYYQQQNLLPI
jgi:hypothetical protein